MPFDKDPYRTFSQQKRIASKIVSLELLWPFPLMTIGVLGIQNRFIIAAGVVLLTLPWCARIVLFRRPTQQSYIGGALALLVVSAFMGMRVTYDPALSLPSLLTLMGSVGFFFAIVNTSTDPRRIGSVLVIIASLAAVYYIGHEVFVQDQALAGWLSQMESRMTILMPDLGFLRPQANALAGFVEGAFLLSLALVLQARTGQRLIWGLATIILAAGLLKSGSRGSWIGIAVAMGVVALMLIPGRRRRLVVAGLVGTGSMIGIYVLFQFSPIGQSIYTRLLETTASRFILYRNSYHLLSEYVFTGIGPGETFAMVYSRYQLLIPVPFLAYPHNLPLAVGLGYGLPGLVALIWLLVKFYTFVAWSANRGLSVRSSPIFSAAWLGTTASFVHGLTDSPQFSSSRWTMPMLFALLGLAIAAQSSALKQGDRQTNIKPSPKRQIHWIPALGAITAATLIISITVFRKPLAGAWYANIGAVYQTWADLSPGLTTSAREENALQAEKYYEMALGLSPSQPTANRRLGMIASEQENFSTAVSYLETAYQQAPKNQGTLKALGLTYTWIGQMDAAEDLLRQLDDQSEMIEELGTWCWWWESQGQEAQSVNACEMAHRLSEPR
jgi:O-antigen ligase